MRPKKQFPCVVPIKNEVSYTLTPQFGLLTFLYADKAQIPKKGVFDRDPDRVDGVDEKAMALNCTQLNICNTEQPTYSSGLHLHHNWTVDQDEDCGDGSGEVPEYNDQYRGADCPHGRNESAVDLMNIYR